MEGKDQIVVIASFNSLGEAQLCKSLLESAGIPARMRNDIAAQVLSVYGGMMQVEVMVAAENEKKAREILSAGFDREEFEKETHTKPRRKK